jgi:hypothetical protein
VSGWSREEVEATVADYLDMLLAERSGAAYNKKEHNRRLQRLLNNRSTGAIERKHMNVSAILHEIGFPSIDGYKPLGNYQALLRDVVIERLASNAELVRVVAEEVDRPANSPAVGGAALVAVECPPPQRSSLRAAREGAWKRRRAPPAPMVDYLEREARNHALGEKGEAFVIRFEQERLARAGQERLASQIQHVAKTRGPSEGFDILSFEMNGEERLIEVKTTRYGARTPFYLSRNEVAVSEGRSEQYQLYRVFAFEESPRLFRLPGAVSVTCRLLPNEYVATVA